MIDRIWERIDKLIENPTKYTKVSDEKTIKDKNVIKVIITRTGTHINAAELDDQTIKKIKNYFTIRDKTIMGYERKTSCFKHENDRIYVPRFASFLLSGKFNGVSYKNKINLDNRIKILYTGEPPTHIQSLILKELENKWFTEKKIKVGRCGVIINLQAGYGKTYLSMNLIAQLQLRTLIVVHNKTILKQWRDLLIAKFPNNNIACYYGENKEFGDIVIGVINSLILPEIKGFSSPQDFYNKFDVIIFDECHEYCASGRSKIFNYQCPYMIGLSATPEERNDNLGKIIKWNIGPILEAEKIDGYTTENIPFRGNVIKVKYCGPDKFTRTIVNKKLETISATKMIEQFTMDFNRTKLIAELTMEHYKKGYNIFVFADRRDYLEIINIHLQKIHINGEMLTNDDELKSIKLMGGSTENEMRDAIESKRIILTTYAYMGTGCSIPKMNCIILATPRRTKSRQIINRIFRLGSDYSIVRQIIDIIDWKTPLKNQYYERAKYYKSQNFTFETRMIKIPN